MNNYTAKQLSLFQSRQAAIQLVKTLLDDSKPGDRFTLGSHEFHCIAWDIWQITPDPRYSRHCGYRKQESNTVGKIRDRALAAK